MDWIDKLFTVPSFTQAIIILSAISAIGVVLGRFKIKGLSFGVGGVLLTGILAGHLGFKIDPQMLVLAQNFGLIIFIYSLGLQVGPGFFASIKKGGIGLNLLSIGLIFTGTMMTLIYHWTLDIPLSDMMGVFSGAVTNTPMLGAAQQAMLQIHPDQIEASNNMALCCAIAYPFGIIGVILAIVILRIIFSKSHKPEEVKSNAQNTFLSEFHVINPSIYGLSILEIKKLSEKNFVISRLWKNGQVSIPTSKTIIEKDDHVLVISNKSDIPFINTLFGEREETDWNKPDIDWNSIDSQLVSRHILITKDTYTGTKLGSLKLRNTYGINITRINRAGIDLLPSPALRLQVGDKLTIVGESMAIDNVGKLLGNKEKDLNTPNIFAIFAGIILGLILGSIPIHIPGISVPIMIGIAGGPMVVGILMGSFGTSFHITTYSTKSANLMLQQLGLTVYLAALGLGSGAEFFNILINGDGVLWIWIGLSLAAIPVLIMGIITSKIFKINYASNIGMLCGSMANPMALNYITSITDSDEPAVSYATVYPLGIFLRIIIAQFVMLFIS